MTTKKRKIKVIYGWYDQGEASFGVHREELEDPISIDADSFAEDGRLYTYHMEDRIPDGTWFPTFRQAKKACMEYWENQLKIAKYAISTIAKAKKESL